MKISYLFPSFNVHGGIRVGIEHCNHLAARGHDVTIHNIGAMRMPSPWIEIDSRVGVIYGPVIDPDQDVIVAMTPPTALSLHSLKTKAKKFYFLQMAEHLFAPKNHNWVTQCHYSYKVPFPIIGISRWVEAEIRALGRKGEMYYIGNGVSDHFKPGKIDGELTILVEGWEPKGNAAKDVLNYGPSVAKWAKEEFGAKIIAYSAHPIQTMKDVPDEYYCQPDPKTIVRLYQRAWFMLKCTKYDARSCAPVEAMKCGTPTVRAIDKGDDDLINLQNCLKSKYTGGYDEILHNVTVLANVAAADVRYSLSENGLKYAKENLNWNRWIDELEKIFAA